MIFFVNNFLALQTNFKNIFFVSVANKIKKGNVRFEAQCALDAKNSGASSHEKYIGRALTRPLELSVRKTHRFFYSHST